jgi:hypothetical protein
MTFNDCILLPLFTTMDGWMDGWIREKEGLESCWNLASPLPNFLKLRNKIHTIQILRDANRRRLKFEAVKDDFLSQGEQ